MVNMSKEKICTHCNHHQKASSLCPITGGEIQKVAKKALCLSQYTLYLYTMFPQIQLIASLDASFETKMSACGLVT